MSAEPMPTPQRFGVTNFFRSLRTVAWAFVGLRGRKGHQRDMEKVKPVHVIVVGVVGAVAFVFALISIVNKVLGQ